jgi:zinc/manganese transport system permease protein
MIVLADLFGIGEMLSHAFMRNAFLAGTAIAAASGLVGYFLVLRSQVFSGDALSHVAFTGALAALAFGIDIRVGLFVSVAAISMLLGALGRRGRADDVVIGSVFVWILGLGVLFLSLFTSSRATSNSTAGVSVLFGSIFGLDDNRTATAVVVALAVSAAMLFIARPLLFASIDEAVAAARGVPVRALGYFFLILVGLTAAEATQAIGALLLLGLLAAPAAAAQRITTRPYPAFVISAALAIGSTWTGLFVSYRIPKLPPSFAIVATVTAVYAATAVFAGRSSFSRQ